MSNTDPVAGTGTSMSLQWGGFSFSLTGDAALVREGFELLRSEIFPNLFRSGPPAGGKSNSGSESTSTTGTDTGAAATENDVSPAQFVQEKQPKTEMEKATVLAYYLKKYRGTTEFTLENLESLYNEAHVPIRNVKNAIGNASKKVNGGLLKTLQGKRGIYHLTAAGESYVKTKLPH